MKGAATVVRGLVVVAIATGFSAKAAAFSVLAHEAIVDAAWADRIRPLLAARYPGLSSAQLDEARAYAYGGSVIQDVGYYPFGNHFFSNLLHYTRSGDFVEALITEARSAVELAFALGALAHYVGDNTGHTLAVNRAVPLMFPKLQRRYGDQVTYVESPTAHVRVEFSFDVVQVATGRYATKSYHDFVGFGVAVPLLERAFRRTYGLDLATLLPDADKAVSTYRHAISELVPEITRVAWRDKRDEIAELVPGTTEQDFVFQIKREDYDREFGTAYQKPRLFTKVLVFFYKILPKIGPLKPLKFKAPTPEAERLFLEALRTTTDRYRNAVARIRTGRLDLANTDFDTGRPAVHGEYSLADDTYAELLERLEASHFESVPEALRRNITAFYGGGPSIVLTNGDVKREQEIRRQLVALADAVQ
jgi:zinc dependent phospholipase C